MELVVKILIIIIATVLMVWSGSKASEKYYNIKALRDAKKHPDMAKQKNGMVYNKKKKRLEAANSPITPFN
jgi:hypothetical protein